MSNFIPKNPIKRKTGKTFSKSEVKSYVEEAGIGGFNEIKREIINIIKSGFKEGGSKALQSIADKVYAYIFNDVPDNLQDDAEMLADQLLEEYSGRYDQEERDIAQGNGSIDSNELRRAMDRSSGLESGIFDGIKNKIGNKFDDMYKKENEKWKKEAEDDGYHYAMTKYKPILREKFINWYSNNDESYGPEVNARAYLDKFTDQVIRQMKLDLIAEWSQYEDRADEREDPEYFKKYFKKTSEKYIAGIRHYADFLYSNIEKYMLNEQE